MRCEDASRRGWKCDVSHLQASTASLVHVFGLLSKKRKSSQDGGGAGVCWSYIDGGSRWDDGGKQIQ